VGGVRYIRNMIFFFFAFQQPAEPVNPWTGPAILAGLLALVGILLTVARDILQRRVMLSVKPVLQFTDQGIADLEVFITNEGYRPFTLVSASLTAEGRRSETVYSSMCIVTPGASVHFKIEEFLAWLNSECLLVDIAPGKSRQVRLPHQSEKFEHHAKRILATIAKSGSPYRFFKTDVGEYFGNGRTGVAVEPRILAIAGNDEIGRSTCSDTDDQDKDAVIKAIIQHLADKHPEFFDQVKVWPERTILRWRKDVINRFR